MSAEELLSKTVTQLPPPAAGVCSGDALRVKDTARQLEEVAKALRDTAPDLGIEGQSGDAGAEAFTRVMHEVFRRADECTAAADVASTAYEALMRAKEAYQGLPPGEIDSTQRSFYLHGGMAINPGGMSLTGPAAVNYLDQQAARSREYQAQQILNQLNAEMTAQTRALPRVAEPFDPTGRYVPPSPTPRGGGGGTGSYTPGGVGSTGVGGVPSGSGAVLDQPTWSPSTGAGAGAQNPVTGSGVTSPGTIGSGTPGGSTPGSGSADGLVGGTVPGAAGPGTIGAGTGTGTGVGGAGVLAGGTAIGGAALGAAGLGRTGAGGTGAGRIGGIGGAGGINAGGMGGAGGLGAGAGGAGAPGAGVRGSTGIGATPPGASPTGTGTGAAAGGRGMTGMPMGGGGAGAGSTKNKRTGTANYLVPDLGIDEDPTTTPLGPGARAGSRDQQPPPIIDDTLDDPDDDTW